VAELQEMTFSEVCEQN